jgi:hypothetical protein
MLDRKTKHQISVNLSEDEGQGELYFETILSMFLYPDTLTTFC